MNSCSNISEDSTRFSVRLEIGGGLGKLRAAFRAFGWYARKRFLKGPERGVIFGDRVFHFYKDGFASNSIKLFGEWNDYDALHFIDTWLRPDHHYLDVGANVGVFTLLASKHVKDSQIVCVEPGRKQLAQLRENLAANGLHPTVLPFCVSDQPGTLRMTLEDAASHVALESDHGASEEVEVKRIDDIVPDEVYALLKMDVEGVELKALNGAIRLIRENKLPAILFELNGASERFGIPPTAVPEFLEGLGYQLGIYRHDERAFDTTAKLWGDVLALSPLGMNMLAERMPDVRVI